jgi:hypothetical protein
MKPNKPGYLMTTGEKADFNAEVIKQVKAELESAGISYTHYSDYNRHAFRLQYRQNEYMEGEVPMYQQHLLSSTAGRYGLINGFTLRLDDSYANKSVRFPVLKDGGIDAQRLKQALDNHTARMVARIKSMDDQKQRVNANAGLYERVNKAFTDLPMGGSYVSHGVTNDGTEGVVKVEIKGYMSEARALAIAKALKENP